MINLRFKTVPIVVVLLSTILVGCGQKGPLTLPKPQFPAPEATPAPPKK